ncbi:hypothetical protein BC826DRAFT_1042012 [Russula brevipes]|nr:hypothetical protein BC826DRAFT_1042012 [Russula brevipes]
MSPSQTPSPPALSLAFFLRIFNTQCIVYAARTTQTRGQLDSTRLGLAHVPCTRGLVGWGCGTHYGISLRMHFDGYHDGYMWLAGWLSEESSLFHGVVDVCGL